MRILLVACLFAMALCAARGAAAEQWIADARGTLEINEDGSVGEVSIDESFGAELDAGLIGKISNWRFHPIVEDGRPIRALAHMSFDLHARRNGDGGFDVRIARVTFDDPPEIREALYGANRTLPPRYPRAALNRRLGAFVELLLAVDRSGRVADVAPLDGWVTGPDVGRPEAELKPFTRSAVAAVKQWTLPPCDEAELCFRRVPIRYKLHGSGPWHRATPVAAEPHPLHAERDAQMAGADGVASERVRLLSAVDTDYTPPQG